MNFTDYIELQVTSNFSFLRGASHPEELIQAAASLGYQALALTDLHTLSGIVRAFEAAKENGISLIVGTALELYADLPDEPTLSTAEPLDFFQKRLPLRLYLYATSVESYGNMSALLTKGKMRAPKGCCFLTLADLTGDDLTGTPLTKGTAGLIAGVDLIWPVELYHSESCPPIQLLPTASLNFSNQAEDMQIILSQLREIFDRDRLSLLLHCNYRPQEEDIIAYTVKLAKQFSIPLMATNDVCYHLPERKQLQDILTCIRSGLTLEEAGFKLYGNEERYLKSPEEMKRIFRRFPQAIERTAEVASRCVQFSLAQLKYEYPCEICPAGKEPIVYLEEITWSNARERYPQGVPENVQAQLEHELRLVRELDYAKYFLTVFDIVNFAKSKQILAQGRGAAANSAICYVLGITSVDPNHINLLFERFVSRERDEPPDIDIDFEHERREEVIQYIYSKFGRMRAALVSEVITYRTRSAIREVGKVFGLSAEQLDVLSKTVRRSDDGNPNEAELRAVGLDPQSKAISHTITFARIIKRFPRHLSQHVGGFIVSEQELSRIVPIENAAMPGRTIIEWDKDDIETMGMLKIDVLALGMLTCIRKALQLINKQQSPAQPLTLYNIPAEDPAVYHMLSAADTVGVFQIESRAQMSMLPRLKPKTFFDLVIEVAIVRPGPIVGGMVHPYLRRRNGSEPISYPSEAVKKVLESTLGVPIFQEQVMQLAMVAAGFSGGEADKLRRAMSGWRKRDGLLEEYGKRIVAGMLERGYDAQFAQKVFEQIHGFGEYGFPQSHAASFALLVYVSSWIKHYYPAIFTASLLNSQPMGFYQPAQLIEDAKRHGVVVKPIDVNSSHWDCTVTASPTPNSTPDSTEQVKAKTSSVLQLGFRLISGLQKREAELIATSKSNSATFKSEKFKTLKELWRRTRVRVFTLRKLAHADAFLSLGLSRQQALWEIARYREEELPLFAQLHDPEADPQLPLLGNHQLVLADYEHTGFSLKGHPLSFLRKSLTNFGVSLAEDLRSEANYPHKKRVRVAGLILVRQRPSTAKGVAFLTLEDETGFINLIVPPTLFASEHRQICESSILLVEGHIERQAEVVYVKTEQVRDISSALCGIESQSRDFH